MKTVSGMTFSLLEFPLLTLPFHIAITWTSFGTKMYCRPPAQPTSPKRLDFLMFSQTVLYSSRFLFSSSFFISLSSWSHSYFRILFFMNSTLLSSSSTLSTMFMVLGPIWCSLIAVSAPVLGAPGRAVWQER